MIKMKSPQPSIKVIGFGGAGCNTINRLAQLAVPDIQLIAANTDAQALGQCQAQEKLLLGKSLTRGFGAGGNPEIGKRAAQESYRELIYAMRNADILFMTAGMGGGTGSGAIQMGARMARSLDIPAIGVVTLPFSFESGRRYQCAAEATSSLYPLLNTLITIPNDRLLSLCAPETGLNSALALADDILIQGILGISGLIHNHGQLDIDLSHILHLMNANGGSYISTGQASGENRVVHAIQNALENPLLDGISLQDAKGIIIKISGDAAITEITQALEFVRSQLSLEAEIIPAIVDTDQRPDFVKVMLFVSGVGAQPLVFNPPHIVRADDLTQTPAELPDDYTAGAGENILSQQLEDDLSVPAFIRKGYNWVGAEKSYYAS